MAGDSRRFEFGWLEVLGLILVFAGGSVVVFFLGVFVGKGLQESRLAREERVVRLPIDPQSEEPPAPLARATAGPLVVAPTSGLRLAVRPAPTPIEAEPQAERSGSPLLRETSEPSPIPKTSPAPLPTLPALAPPVATPPALARPVATDRPPSRPPMMGGPRGKWAVQVNATRDAYTARKIVQDLRRRGYNAYAVEVPLRGEIWYRVRVGRFQTMQEATAMVVRLKGAERYRRAFLVEE